MLMEKKRTKKLFFFVDESGDPYFYDRRGKLVVGKTGCSKLLILGFIKTEEPAPLRKTLAKVREAVDADSYLKGIPSTKKSLLAFHATDDSSEVREKIFKSIVELPFKAEFVVARKNETVFLKRHKKRPNLFYDDLVSKLFQNQLHKSEENIIYFAVRGNRARQIPLEDAIRKAVLTFEQKWQTKIDARISVFPQRPAGEPCLQITDYMTWAVQRAFTKGEMRYLDFVREKISLIVDLYDFKKYPKNYYNRTNSFDVKKMSHL